MGKTATTWRIMGDSWAVLKRDKELLFFPVAAGVASFLVLVSFVIPFIGAAIVGHGLHQLNAAMYVTLFCYYVCNVFVVVYLNSALVVHVVTRMRGGEPTLRGSFAAATACLPQIALWSVVVATVGVILRWVAERSNVLGRIVVALVGFAWGLVTIFVVPILVVERKGMLEAIDGSKDLLLQTWGRQIVSSISYGLIGFLLSIPAYLAIIFAMIAGALLQSFATFGVILTLAVLYLVGLGIVLSALRAIFGAVLYLYARTGEAPAGFDPSLLRSAIKPA